MNIVIEEYYQKIDQIKDKVLVIDLSIPGNHKFLAVHPASSWGDIKLSFLVDHDTPIISLKLRIFQSKFGMCSLNEEQLLGPHGNSTPERIASAYLGSCTVNDGIHFVYVFRNDKDIFKD